jgi:hypothetical protein
MQAPPPMYLAAQPVMQGQPPQLPIAMYGHHALPQQEGDEDPTLKELKCAFHLLQKENCTTVHQRHMPGVMGSMMAHA